MVQVDVVVTERVALQDCRLLQTPHITKSARALKINFFI
jgi:hypothetical protein